MNQVTARIMPFSAILDLCHPRVLQMAVPGLLRLRTGRIRCSACSAGARREPVNSPPATS